MEDGKVFSDAAVRAGSEDFSLTRFGQQRLSYSLNFFRLSSLQKSKLPLAPLIFRILNPAHHSPKSIRHRMWSQLSATKALCRCGCMDDGAGLTGLREWLSIT